MTLSRLDQALEEIAPGEHRVLKRIAEPSVEANRWFVVMQNSEIGRRDLFRWVNRPDLLKRPTATHHYCDYIGVRSISTPVLEFQGQPKNHLDLYTAGDSFFVSARLFDVFQKLDPDSIEWVEADVRGAAQRYYYCLCKRSIKAIDENATTILLGPGKVVAFEDDNFAISDAAVPPYTHCFTLYYSARPIWSRKLVDATIASGATGLTLWPPFVSPLSTHTIRI